MQNACLYLRFLYFTCKGRHESGASLEGCIGHLNATCKRNSEKTQQRENDKEKRTRETEIQGMKEETDTLREGNLFHRYFRLVFQRTVTVEAIPRSLLVAEILLEDTRTFDPQVAGKRVPRHDGVVFPDTETTHKERE